MRAPLLPQATRSRETRFRKPVLSRRASSGQRTATEKVTGLAGASAASLVSAAEERLSVFDRISRSGARRGISSNAASRIGLGLSSPSSRTVTESRVASARSAGAARSVEAPLEHRQLAQPGEHVAREQRPHLGRPEVRPGGGEGPSSRAGDAIARAW